jgi:hypothetical protein
MNRLPSHLQNHGNPEGHGPDAASLLARTVREPALLRLAQSIEELNPDLARALCRSGLEAIADPIERESWRARLAPWLEDGDGDDGGSILAAA